MRSRILPLSLVATAVTAVLVVPAITAGSPAMAVPGAGSPVFINEIHYDNDSTDTGEAIEIAAPAGTDLAGWSLVLYNGAATVRAPYNTRALSGIVPDQGAGFGTVAFSYPTDGIQNGSPDGIALVNGSAVVQFLSYEGVFDAVSGPAAGQTSTDIGVAEASSTLAGQSLQLAGTGVTASNFTWGGPAAATFGQPNSGQTFGTPGTTTTTSSTTTTTLPPTGPCLPSPAVTPISEVQGTTDQTPCPAGRTITIEGVVVGDYEGPAPALRGFYVQEQDIEHDGDPATSEGVFVFNANADSVALGDVVTVTGRVEEFQGQTQLSNATVAPAGDVQTVTPTEVTLPFPEPTFVERYEGMLVHFPQELSVTEHFQLGRFGQVVVSSGGRLRQPTTVVEPGAPARALQAANNLNRIIVDDELNNQNRDPIVFGRGGNPLSAANTLRGGDTVADLLGVMTFTWGGNTSSPNAYRVRPIGALGGAVPNFGPANPRPPAAPHVDGDLRIANFNVLNYFLTLDIGTTRACGPNGFKQECRGANTDLELQRQRAKLLAALVKLDADVLGLIELENSDSTVPGEPVDPLADIVDALNAIDGAGTYDYVDTGLIGTDTIRVGIVYRPGVVTPFGAHAILDSSVDARFDDDRNRPSLAQTFARKSNGEIFTVVVNHLKSKSCDNTATGGDVDSGDGAACFNATRTAAAEALVAWMRRHPTGVRDDDFIVMGDFNAYAKETPMDVLAAAGFVDLVARADPDGYSFAFDGQWGALDYALASASFAAQHRGAADYHINADEPTVLDYNTDFKSPDQIESLFAPDEFRTSDHDPVISGYDLDALRRATLIPQPFQLWPPNHTLVPVDVFGFDGMHRLDVDILKVASSEADANLGPDDLPDDIVRVDKDTYRLRAERFHRDGRRYTITALVTNGRQSSIETTTVVVPHSRSDHDLVDQ